MKRVLIVGFTKSVGGMETYVMNIYRHLDREKLQFDFLVLHDHEMAYGDEVQKLGGKIYFLPDRSENLKEHKALLKHIFNNNEYIGLYFQAMHVPMTPEIFKMAKKHHVPIRAMHAHSSVEKDTNVIHRIRRYFTGQALKHYVNSNFACSQDAGKWLFGNRDYKVISNGIDTKLFSYNSEAKTLRNRFDIPENVFIIGTVGRLSYEKNPYFLLAVINELKKTGFPFVFLHIGGGVWEKDVHKKAADMDIIDSCRFLGERTDVPELLSLMDLFLLPSHYEGFPISLVEAQSTGLHCFVSDIITRTVDLTGNVKFLKIDDAGRWAKAIREELPYERTGQSDVIASKGYDIRQIADYFENYFLGGKP